MPIAISYLLGYLVSPTLLRSHGFAVRMYLPPREHGPAHVHVVKADGEVVVTLGDHDRAPMPTRVVNLRDIDVIAAVRLVAAHNEELMAQWRSYHD